MTGSRHPAPLVASDTARLSGTKAPSLPPARILQLLSDIPGGQHNLLPVGATIEPLRVEFEMWQNSEPSPDFPETLTLYWDGTKVGSRTWATEVLPEELFILVPVERMGDGQHTLYYHVVLGDGNDATSHELTVTIDKTSPVLPAMSYITFPPEVISAGVTDKYLRDNGDALRGTTSAYQGGNAGDLLIWYWATLPGGPGEVGRRTLSKAEAGQPLQISIPGDVIRLEDGLHFAYFSIQDRAQTDVQRGKDIPLQAKATPGPRTLPPPTIMEADGGSNASTLRPIQAVSGATLLVTESEDIIDPGETIEVFWSTPGSRGAFSTTTPVEPGKRAYRIPADKVAEQSGYNLTLYYKVLQSDGEEALSKPHTLKVEAVSNLPTPSCDKVNGGQLSIKQLAGGTAKVSAQAWPFVAMNQNVKLELYGRARGDGKNLRRSIGTTAVTSTSGEVQIGTFNKADLEYFTLNERLEILAYATFDGSLTWQPFALLSPLLVG